MKDLFLIKIIQLAYLRNLHLRLCTSIRNHARPRLNEAPFQHSSEICKTGNDSGRSQGRQCQDWKTKKVEYFLLEITCNTPLANINNIHAMTRQLKNHLCRTSQSLSRVKNSAEKGEFVLSNQPRETAGFP